MNDFFQNFIFPQGKYISPFFLLISLIFGNSKLIMFSLPTFKVIMLKVIKYFKNKSDPYQHGVQRMALMSTNFRLPKDGRSPMCPLS